MITLTPSNQSRQLVDHWGKVARDLDDIFRKAALAVAPRLAAELRRRMTQGAGEGQETSENDPVWLAGFIRVWVDDRSVVWVGIADEEASAIAFDMEHGTVVNDSYEPARPVMRPVVTEMQKTLTTMVEREIVRQLSMRAR